MKPLLLVLLLALACSKHNDSHNLVGTWKWESYVGAIPFVPAPDSIVFTNNTWTFYNVYGNVETGTYQLMDAISDPLKCKAYEGFTRRILYNPGQGRRDYINISGNKLRINHSCSEMGVVYRRN